MTSTCIDEEWHNFLLTQSDQSNSLVNFQFFENNNPDSKNTQQFKKCIRHHNDIDDIDEFDEEDVLYGHENESDYNDSDENELGDNTETESLEEPSKDNVTNGVHLFERKQCEELYISTQTQIFFLNTQDVDVEQIFWNIAVIDYGTPSTGVVKKQMRVISLQKEEFEKYQEKVKHYGYYTEKIMKQIDNPKARKIKYKDVRKLTVGISKKDIMNCHGKNKSAFINCFAVILRVKYENIFHEIHVKVFNTGKLAIPGIVNEGLLQETKAVLLGVLQPSFEHVKLQLIPANESPLVKRLVRGKKTKDSSGKEDGGNIKSHFEYVQPKGNVLINSNFNCGYYIQQEKLKQVLREKYNLNPSYDPSMYPGVKCKFFYNNELPRDASVQKGILSDVDKNVTITELDELSKDKYTKVSFMVFRTGNCLIVGNCTRDVLQFVFEYVKRILMDEYEFIKAIHDVPVVKLKKKKPRKRTVLLERSYFNSL